VRLYFGTALPLHEEDEEDALKDRVRASSLDPLFDRLRKEHGTIEGVLEKLLPLWEQLETSFEHVVPNLAVTLAAAFGSHLRIGEEAVFTSIPTAA
jgi:hypothetical protein